MTLPVSSGRLTTSLCSSEHSHNGEADHGGGTLWLVAPQGPVPAHTKDCRCCHWPVCSVCTEPAFSHSSPPKYAPPSTSGRSRSRFQPASASSRPPPCLLRCPPKPRFSGRGSKVRPPARELSSHGVFGWLSASCCPDCFSRSIGCSRSLSGTGYTWIPQTSCTGCQFWHAQTDPRTQLPAKHTVPTPQFPGAHGWESSTAAQQGAGGFSSAFKHDQAFICECMGTVYWSSLFFYWGFLRRWGSSFMLQQPVVCSTMQLPELRSKQTKRGNVHHLQYIYSQSLSI